MRAVYQDADRMLLLVVLSASAARRGGTAPTEEQAESTAAVDRAHRMSQLDKTGAALLRSIGLSPNNLSEHDMATLQHAYSRVVTAPDEATAAFEAVRAANPGHPTVLSLAAVLADAKGDPLKAIELQEAALLVDPDVIGLQQGLADFYLRAGRIAAGRVVLDKIIATPSATPAERQRAQKQRQNEVPRRMSEVRPLALALILTLTPNPSLTLTLTWRKGLVRALEAADQGAAAPLLHGLAAQHPAELMRLQESLVDRCSMRTAAALVGMMLAAPHAADDASLHFAAARIARWFGDEAQVQRMAARTLALSPPRPGSGSLRSQALSLQRRYHEAFAEERRAHAERVGSSQRALPPVVTMFKLEHDAAQLRYLAARDLLSGGGKGGGGGERGGGGGEGDAAAAEEVAAVFEAAAGQIGAACAKKRRAAISGASSGAKARAKAAVEMPDCDPFAHEGGYAAMRPQTRRRVEAELNAPRRNLPFSAWEGKPALNLNCCDWGALEESYLAGEVLVLDDFLSKDALAELLRLGLESTNWNSVKAGGYLGGFTSDGFAPPVVAQLALDLEAAMPRVLAAHSLLMFWGFKHDTTRTRSYHGIKAHADTAAVNLNFWVTPDEANLDPHSGGLIVYRASANHSESITTTSNYNNYELGASQLGLDSSSVLRRVPYRQNRAVLFISSLFHATDTVDFKPGFETCRINYTLLFGFMDAVRCPAAAPAPGDTGASHSGDTGDTGGTSGSGGGGGLHGGWALTERVTVDADGTAGRQARRKAKRKA